MKIPVNQTTDYLVQIVYDDYEYGNVSRRRAKAKLLKLGCDLNDIENDLGQLDELLSQRELGGIEI